MKDPTWWQYLFVIGLAVAAYLMIGIGRGWRMRAFQLTIFLAVVGSDIQWHWSPNPNFPPLVGIALAYFFTVLLPMDIWPYEYKRRPPDLVTSKNWDKSRKKRPDPESPPAPLIGNSQPRISGRTESD